MQVSSIVISTRTKTFSSPAYNNALLSNTRI